MSRLALLLVALLVVSGCSQSVLGRNAKNFKPSKYWQASQDEYAAGAIANAAIPDTQPQQILTSLSGTQGTIVSPDIAAHHQSTRMRSC